MQYALQGIRGILEFESAYPDISNDLVDRVLHFLVTAAQPNVLRPSSAIIRKLVQPHSSKVSTTTPSDATTQAGASGDGTSGKGYATPGVGPAWKGKGKVTGATEPPIWGFDRIWSRLQSVGSGNESSEVEGAEGVLRVVVKRIEGAGDLELVAQR